MAYRDESELTRLTTLPFPAYRFVPSQFPHPRSDAAGHSFGLPEPHVASFDPHCWGDCQAFLFGFDLFHDAYYWEAHEQWEAVWIAVGRHGAIADLLKGLIKLAAMGVKAREGKEPGFRRHQDRAVELFRSVCANHDRLAGLSLQSLIDLTQAQSFEDASRQGRLAVVMIPSDG